MTSEQPPPPAGRPVTEKATDAVNEAVDWVRAFALGVRDTAKDMLDAGRKGATDAYGEGWERFDAKTKGRRRRE